MTTEIDENWSEPAKAYVREYGHLPSNREEQDRYSAYRFGFEAGVTAGFDLQSERVIRFLGGRK